MLEALARWIYRHKWATLIITGVLLVGSVIVLVRGGHLTAGTIRGLEADRAESVVGEVLGQSPDATFVAIFQAKDRASGGAPFHAAVRHALAPLRAEPAVLAVVTQAQAAA